MIAHVALPQFRRIGQHGVDVGATDEPADGLIGDRDAEVFLVVILDAERSLNVALADAEARYRLLKASAAVDTKTVTIPHLPDRGGNSLCFGCA